MSSTLASPQPAASLRRYLARLWDDPESRSVLIGLLGMLLVHLLLWVVAPYLLRSEPIHAKLRPAATARQFNIEIAPDAFVKPPPPKPPPMKFVETNPNAPENVPDKTNNFSSQNQQVAQEKPTPDGKSDRPALEGQKDIHSTQIVDGRLAKPTPPEPAPEPVPEKATQQQLVTSVKQEQNPLPGFEKKQSEDASSFGSNVAKFPENAKPIPEKIDGAKHVPLIQGAQAMQPQIDRNRPRPRPQIVSTPVNTRPSIFEENKIGTSNVGIIGIDAKWSNYGQYLRKMIDTVQIQWENILIESKVYPRSGTQVTVKFRLDKEGKIPEIISVEGTAGNQAEKACTSAITLRAPYGPWTDDMIALLGESQEMTFAFYYQ